MPLTLEELKVDSIVLSWILMTLSDTLQVWLVVEHPRSAKEAWNLITHFKDNKRSRTIALKAKLRSLNLGDLSMDAYFRKVESLTTILTSLESPVNSEDVVTFALEGVPDKYKNVCGIITHQEPFSYLRTARSMLTTEEMRLKPKSQSLPVDSSSSSPMVLVTQSGNNRCSSTPQVETLRPCYNFTRGSCRFGDPCRFVHDPYMQAKSNNDSL
nr:hybrid signal transduction histidine kinase M [Tanacetum cinerariifolium]